MISGNIIKFFICIILAIILTIAAFMPFFGILRDGLFIGAILCIIFGFYYGLK
jgi:hypothetical protein